jgi:hypothetical protein
MEAPLGGVCLVSPPASGTPLLDPQVAPEARIVAPPSSCYRLRPARSSHVRPVVVLLTTSDYARKNASTACTRRLYVAPSGSSSLRKMCTA